MSLEYLWNDTVRWQQTCKEQNLSQSHFVQNKSHGLVDVGFVVDKVAL
jgi:hypothetical protein